MPATVESPLHILHLSTPDTPSPSLLKDSEIHQISTVYYNASIPIWRDVLPTTAATISAWKDEWTALEAREVIRAVGAWIVSFPKPRTQDDLHTVRKVLSMIGQVVEHHRSGSYDIGEALMLAVGMPQLVAPSLEMRAEDWEDLGRECGGWEWIDGEVEGSGGKKGKAMKGLSEEGDGIGNDLDDHDFEDRNELGEKVGMARLKEALEANEWEAGDPDDFEGLDDLGFDDDGDDASLGFGQEVEEAQTEMWGLRGALAQTEKKGEEIDEETGEKEGGDEAVQELEAMMLKLQAVRDMGADMPEGERRKVATKAVREVMKK